MDEIIAFYERLDWELADIDDEDTLFWQLDESGNYATITDENGKMPESLDIPVIFSVYDDRDSFQWSVTLEDSRLLDEYIHHHSTIEELLQALRHLREDKIEEYMRGE